MFSSMLDQYLGVCPSGYEIIRYLFGFFLLFIALEYIYRIFDILFSIFRRGR